jgi:16S rRNA (cytidine1402-2'-O)-methyltransferase
MLKIVALPIGHKDDITLRALQALKAADVIIGEERKELIPLLKSYDVDIHSKQIEFLNEHSDKIDIEALGQLCKDKNVVLVSDCGTPVFCDPGALLIKYCRESSIKVDTLPGASSLMALLSLSSEKLGKFYFYGFLPRQKEERMREIQRISKMKEAVIVMDTPYRFAATIEHLATVMPARKALIAADITLPTEMIFEGHLKSLVSQTKNQKKEFMVLIY